jgi:hypothetical protein
MLTAFLQEESGDVCFSITADSFKCFDASIHITYSEITSEGRKAGVRRIHMLELLTFVWSKTQ